MLAGDRINIPIANLHYVEFIYKKALYGIFPISPNQFALLFEKISPDMKTIEFQEVVLNQYFDLAIMDKRSG